MTLALAAPASAFTSPELFVRMQRIDTHEGAGEWLALASTPQINDLRGYQVGYRLQASGQANEFQRAALTVAAVPDGQPTQPSNTPPYCVAKTGAVGAIVEVGSELQFEGDGRYTVTVSVGDGAGGASGCHAGPSTTASFTVDVHVALQRLGDPFIFRRTALAGNPFVGVRADTPSGGEAEVRCGVDGAVGADGAPTGRLSVGPGPVLREDLFPEPGVWTCAARGTAEGLDPDRNTTTFGTPWSAPQTFDVRSDFQRTASEIVGPRAKRPRFEVAARFGTAAAGGRLTFTLKRFVRCRRGRAVLQTAGRYRAVLDKTGRARIPFTRPRRKLGYYQGVVTFGGTRFLRAGTDPAVVPLIAERKLIDFVKRSDFPRC